MRDLMAGNIRMGQAAIEAGCRFYAGYPITPQNELTAFMASHMPKAGGVFIQAESELAAINMVFGAAAAGVRALTSSSSPGISLKQEGISYMAGCQLPCVIINVMRAGPGLGYITPAQGDYFQATRGGGHGDYRTICLAPASVQEAGELVYKAFELADSYRIPVMILADAMIGQMMEPVEEYISTDTGKVIDKPWAVTGCKGRDPNVVRSLHVEVEKMKALNDHLQKTYARIQQKEVLFETKNVEDADIVVVAYGSVARIVEEARRICAADRVKVGWLRPISLWPFPSAILEQLSERTKKFLVVEMSAGQMLEDVRLALGKAVDIDFYGTYGGEVPSVEMIIRQIRNQIGRVASG